MAKHETYYNTSNWADYLLGYMDAKLTERGTYVGDLYELLLTGVDGLNSSFEVWIEMRADSNGFCTTRENWTVEIDSYHGAFTYKTTRRPSNDLIEAALCDLGLIDPDEL